MELVRSKSDKPLKATRFAAIRNGIITVLCAALCCLQSAFATPLPGKCDKALYGLSNDGRFLFSLSQPAFSPNLEISVFALPELTSEVVTFHDMPITNRARSIRNADTDIRIGDHNIVLNTGGEVSIFSLASMEDEKRFRVSEPSQTVASFDLMSGAALKVHLSDWAPLPKRREDAFFSAVNYQTGRQTEFFNLQTQFYKAELDAGTAYILIGPQQICFRWAGDVTPSCLTGVTREVFQKDQYLVVVLEKRIMQVYFEDGTLEAKLLTNIAPPIKFETAAAKLTDADGLDLTPLFRNSQTSLRFSSATDDAEMALHMADQSFENVLLLDRESGELRLQSSVNPKLKALVCD